MLVFRPVRVEGAQVDFWTAVQTCFRKYATFQGRARRSEFWYFWLFLILGSIVAAILDAALGFDMDDGGGPIGAVFSLATLIPVLAAVARRLHDTGRSGWWQLSYVIPSVVMVAGILTESVLIGVLGGIGTVVLAVLILVWMASAGDRGPNRFGEDPMGPPVLAQPYGAPGPGPGQPWR